MVEYQAYCRVWHCRDELHCILILHRVMQAVSHDQMPLHSFQHLSFPFHSAMLVIRPLTTIHSIRMTMSLIAVLLRHTAEMAPPCTPHAGCYSIARSLSNKFQKWTWKPLGLAGLRSTDRPNCPVAGVSLAMASFAYLAAKEALIQFDSSSRIGQDIRRRSVSYHLHMSPHVSPTGSLKLPQALSAGIPVHRRRILRLQIVLAANVPAALPTRTAQYVLQDSHPETTIRPRNRSGGRR